MTSVLEIKDRLKGVFDERQAEVLSEVIFSSYDSLVKTSDFNELKWIVKELAEAQKRTDIQLKELAEAQKRTEKKVEELAEAQKRTDIQLKELAEAQKKTEKKVEELAEAQKKTEKKVEELIEAQNRTEIEIQNLTKGLNDTRKQVGGLSNSMGYAFENEVYRMAPIVLKNKYNIEIKENLIRKEIGGKEINILGFGKKGKKNIVIVGEAKLKIEENEIFDELEEKVLAVAEKYKEKIVKILATHYATKQIIKKAQEKDIILIQSFEWL